MRASFSLGIFTLLAQTVATPAQAVVETWVSGTGTDSGSCPRATPCRTFAYAITKTNNGGTINVAEPGSFGPVTIAKSVSIVADGVEAMINTAAGGAAILVQAGPSHVVSLRGLTIDLQGTANHGISFTTGAALHVHNSVIRSSRGIFFQPSSGTGELYVADSVIANTSNSVGIEVRPTGSASANATIDRVRVENGLNTGISFRGEFTTGTIKGTVRDSVVSGNSGGGISASDEGGSGTTTVMVDRSTAASNLTGIAAFDPDATIRIGDSTVSGNLTGLAVAGGGVINSYGTNKIDGNDDNGPVPGIINMQ